MGPLSTRRWARIGRGFPSRSIGEAISYREIRRNRDHGSPANEPSVVWEIQAAKVIRDAKWESLPLQGKTVYVDGRDKTPSFRVEGDGELSKDCYRLLGTEARRGISVGKGILPNRAVSVGEKWQLDASAVLGAILEGLDHGPSATDRSLAITEGKLLRAYKKNGAQFGVLEIRARVPITKYNQDRVEMDLGAGSYMDVTDTIDGCIDGSVADWTVTFERREGLSGKYPDANGNIRAVVSISSVARTRFSIKPDTSK